MDSIERTPARLNPPRSASLPEWLRQRARLTPGRPGLLAEGRCWTFAELDAQVDDVSRRLADLGVGAGDRVGVLAENGAPFVLLVHALIRLRAVLVPLNVRLTAAELAWQVGDASAALLVHGQAQRSLASQVARDSNVPLVLAESLVERGCRPREGNAATPPVVAPDPALVELGEVQCVIYTSGTTGRPKGAMLTHGNHWWSAVGSALNLGLDARDRWLVVLPLFHVGGLSILFRSVIYGIPAVVHSRFDPAAANAAIDDEGVTIVSVVSTMLKRMLETRGDRPYPPAFRCFLLGGGPASPALLKACARSGAPVVQTYGLTETASQVATLAPEDALRKLGSAGRPLFPNEIRIEGDDGTLLGPRRVGQIVVRGPSVTPGYANCPEANAAALVGGWLRTGDLGYLDDEGYLYVVDRRDDLIVSGGENVYPAEVEATLATHPDVEDAGVYGTPDDEWGQVVAAAVKLRPGAAADAEALRRFCRARLAAYKVPRRVRFVADLPRNATGKLLRRSLREDG